MLIQHLLLGYEDLGYGTLAVCRLRIDDARILLFTVCADRLQLFHDRFIAHRMFVLTDKGLYKFLFLQQRCLDKRLLHFRKPDRCDDLFRIQSPDLICRILAVMRSVKHSDDKSALIIDIIG